MIVLLHNIRSLHNVGSIFRTADAAGIEKLYLCGFTPSPIDELSRPRQPLVKVSLGAEKFVLWEKAKSTLTLLKKLKKEGYEIWAIEQSPKSISYQTVKIGKNKIALVVGHEVKGLPQNILDLADKILEIPMAGKKESLNVSVAFGIVVFALKNLK